MIKIYGMPSCPYCDYVHQQIVGHEDDIAEVVKFCITDIPTMPRVENRLSSESIDAAILEKSTLLTSFSKSLRLLLAFLKSSFFSNSSRDCIDFLMFRSNLSF